MKKMVTIDTEFITLGQLLKHIDVISSGGMAKWYLSEHTVFLDGEMENRRGKKIFPGSQVEIPDEGTFFVTASNKKSEEEPPSCI
ncbi:S4 domain-containing protein YaaA [Isobaculum melis]|uniref:S4 domain protein YaaA n=1 Tax=Isobaculum melis TaxID=142588 RepID=A0A1H9UKV5_9LACT|nr:S4 domain-containing protein YaaA [Isobaculum melis]SES09643.1 S4 domain protein YaaA [Isobaculum melis]